MNIRDAALGTLHHDLIVIGASAGGVDALRALVKDLPADLPAALCVVMHLSARGPSLLPAILSRSGRLPARVPRDGEALARGTLYVARPDYHLLIEGERLRVRHGPKENRHRPAIDPLFRSAARSLGPRVIGVVLTGALDDGSAGLHEIKRCGGLAVVQDPEDAQYPSMPRSAMESVQVDHSVKLAELAPLLARLSREPAAAAPPCPPLEPAVAGDLESLLDPEKPGVPSRLSCPDCGGVLNEVSCQGVLRYRCQVGHAFAAGSLQVAQAEALEQALWTAQKILLERIALKRRVLQQSRSGGLSLAAERIQREVQDLEQRAATLRQVLLGAEPEEG